MLVEFEGPKPHEAPVGGVLQVRVTFPAKPFTEVAVIVAVPGAELVAVTLDVDEVR